MKKLIIFIISLTLAIGLTALIFAKDQIFSDALTDNKSADIEGFCREIAVTGRSMEPILQAGDLVCAYAENPQLKDLAVFKCKNCGLAEAIKRVAEIKDGCYWLLGDNPDHSVDSREFGFLCPDDLEYIWKAKKE